jgi:hypothetical protein
VLAVLFTETEFSFEAPLATGTAAGLTKTPTIGAFLPAGSAPDAAVVVFAADTWTGTGFTFGPRLAGLAAAAFTETAFVAVAVDGLFVPAEIGFAFGVTFDFTETAFCVATDVAFTEPAAFVFGTTLVVLAFAPLGEGFAVFVVG